MNIYLDLFLSFAKVGVLTFGGGYAMLPILQREVAENKKWVLDNLPCFPEEFRFKLKNGDDGKPVLVWQETNYNRVG